MSLIPSVDSDRVWVTNISESSVYDKRLDKACEGCSVGSRTAFANIMAFFSGNVAVRSDCLEWLMVELSNGAFYIAPGPEMELVLWVSPIDPDDCIVMSADAVGLTATFLGTLDILERSVLAPERRDEVVNWHKGLWKFIHFHPEANKVYQAVAGYSILPRGKTNT